MYWTREKLKREGTGKQAPFPKRLLDKGPPLQYGLKHNSFCPDFFLQRPQTPLALWFTLTTSCSVDCELVLTQRWDVNCPKVWDLALVDVKLTLGLPQVFVPRPGAT